MALKPGSLSLEPALPSILWSTFILLNKVQDLKGRTYQKMMDVLGVHL